MHKIQRLLLSRLVDQNGRSYSSLTSGYDYEDNVVYHLKCLLKDELIRKSDGKYFITSKGLTESGKYNLQTLKQKKFKHGYISFICRFQDDYLLRGRSTGKQAFYKLPGAKPLFGKDFNIEVERIFKLETNLKLRFQEFEHLTTHAKVQKDSKANILFDDIMFVFRIELSDKQYQKCKLREHTSWYSKDKIKKLEGKWPEVDMCIFEKNPTPFESYEFENDYHLVKV